MKLHGQRCLLCAVAFLTFAVSTTANPASSPDTVAPADVGTDAPPKGGSKAGPIGTEHAPVDGKDGIPRLGPWVETSAERERKKITELSDEATNYVANTKNPTNPKLPQSNDGVMDDKTRAGPEDGKRGTEGGISKKEKDKDTVLTDSKRPDSPKEQPKLPPSELGKLPVVDEDTVKEEKAAIEEDYHKSSDKLKDSMDKSNNLPYTDSSESSDKTVPLDDHRLQNHPSKGRPDSLIPPVPEDIVQPMHSMFLAFTMILVSEIGDKTFLVACLMAMRHDRILVFSAAYAALITMTVLSAVLGHAVPTLIPKWLTNFLAAGLFLVFGVKMLLEARTISPDEGVSEEMKEVEQELEEKEHEALRKSRRRSSISPHILESGRGGIRKSRSEAGRLPSPPDSPISESSSRSGSPSRSTFSNIAGGVNNLFSLLLSPAWVQTFVMTFLGEWGDRSQIATIAMAAGSDYWWVTAGALGGHAICTGVAVIGGKAIAGRVSLRTGKCSLVLQYRSGS